METVLEVCNIWDLKQCPLLHIRTVSLSQRVHYIGSSNAMIMVSSLTNYMQFHFYMARKMSMLTLIDRNRVCC